MSPYTPKLCGRFADVDAPCQCHMGAENNPYLSSGLLHPRYVKEVSVPPLFLETTECLRLNAYVFILVTKH